MVFASNLSFSKEFAAFWSWKLPCQPYLQHFWVRTCHFPWNLHEFATCWYSNC
jgi:hypothetical protein